MATYFVKIAQKTGEGVILTGMVKKGVLKDTMKLDVEGKTVPIERMGRRNPQSMRVEWLKEVKEQEIVQVMVKGVDFETIKKYQGKNVEFQ
ncbi:MAG: hypothetical protein WED05_11285 [Candidatus Atabeyarchaeum deiterrae]